VIRDPATIGQRKEMNIRRLHRGDEKEAISAVHELKPESERQGHDASVEHMRRLLESVNNYLIVADINGSAAGFLIAHRVPRVDRDRFMIYLYEIGVAEAFQRQGIGRRMIELLKREASEDSVTNIWVGTEESNTAARRLYESTGGVPEPELIIEFNYNMES